MNGRAFARFILKLPPEEQALDVRTLVELYDGPTCQDCGEPHLTPWAAIACDEISEARYRANARKRARHRRDDDDDRTR